MNRLDNFRALEHHAWYKKLWAKLKASDIAFAEDFISKTETLDRTEYFIAARNLLIAGHDIPKKRMLIIQEMVECANK